MLNTIILICYAGQLTCCGVIAYCLIDQRRYKR
jgi:hypothetical protein